MQADGNFVVRATDGRALWTSGTWTHRNGARAVCSDDLNLVVYDQTATPWATGTTTGWRPGRVPRCSPVPW
ncbi:hypothetical protein GCM10020229_09260 [Kitasatospora albolonga]|uniref:hypothetical protein n=1 Tax=Kitasatospora albolonga TaxID=68173 RepID=UPI0031F0DEEB